MRNPAVPFALLISVTGASLALALWHPFSPSAPPAGERPTGDAGRGAVVFAERCAGCHGAAADGGIGPALRGSGQTAAHVAAVVATGRGALPAGLVTGRDAADVAAYVATLSE